MRLASVARAGSLLALCVAVTGCTRPPPQLMHPQRGMVTPDEFSVLPAKPIEMPANFAELPAPTPGGTNRTDVNPEAEAVAALGGNPARIVADGNLGADGALIRQATRYGVQPGVRTELAAEDLEFRSRHRGRLLERWFNVPTYYTAYEQQELDRYGALWYYRNRGVPTPAAPPDPKEN